MLCPSPTNEIYLECLTAFPKSALNKLLTSSLKWYHIEYRCQDYFSHDFIENVKKLFNIPFLKAVQSGKKDLTNQVALLLTWTLVWQISQHDTYVYLDT